MSMEIRKTLRFSADEFLLIDEKLAAHNLNFSEFARSAILGKKVHTKLNVDMIFQVQKVGNNLNQIAKALNQKSDIPNSEILKKLIEIEKAIKEFSNDR